MSRKLKPLLACLLLCSSVQSLFSQVSHIPNSVQSPNAASLGLYGDVPVSLYAGLTNVNIPLYDFVEKELNIPISLSYHGSGVRPDVHAGWTGLGWTLACGGSIRRKFNDIPDEMSADGTNLGYYYNYSQNSDPNWNTTSFITQSADNAITLQLDTEPDEFSFDYPGGSGSFYLDHQRNWRVKSDKPVKVTFNGQMIQHPFRRPRTTIMATNLFKSFSGFTITDENGIQYVYGGTTDAIEYEIAMFNQEKDFWKPTSWQLTKIIHPDGYTVTFNYEREARGFVAQLSTSISLDLGSKVSVNGGIFTQVNCTKTSGFSGPPEHWVDGQLISPVYLTSITGGTTSIYFDRSTSKELAYPQGIYSQKETEFPGNYNDYLPCLQLNDGFGEVFPATFSNNFNWEQLDRIRVIDATALALGLPIQKWAFNFTYNDDPTKRLMLQSLTRSNGYNASDQPYIFTYDNSKALPDYLANQIDHWGFFNGTPTTFTNVGDLLSNYYTQRETAEAYLRAGSLSKITYPTGGVTEFTYEPNYYSKRVQENRSLGIDAGFNTTTMAGGLRIRKITSYDPLSPASTISKEYFYLSNYSNAAAAAGTLTTSSGVLGRQPKYYYTDYQAYQTSAPNSKYSQSIFSSQGLLPGSDNSMGVHIGYSEVIEKLADGSYTKYYYSNLDNGHADENPVTIQPSATAYQPASSLAEERGLLTKTEHYTDNDLLLQRTETQYIALNKDNEFVRAISLGRRPTCLQNVTVNEGSAYKIYTYSYLPKTVVTTTFDENGTNAVVTQQDLTYNNTYRQLQQRSSQNSKGEVINTYYRYPYDQINYTPSTTAGPAEVSAFMLQHNMVGSPTEIINTKFTAGTEYVTGSDLTTYKPVAVGVGLTSVRPAIDYSFESTAPLNKASYQNYAVTAFSGSTETVSKDSRLQIGTQYLSYNADGFLRTYSKRNDKVNGILWGFNNNKILADITNVGTGNFAYSSFENNAMGDFNGGITEISHGSPLTGVTSYSGTLTYTVTVPGNYIVNLTSANAAVPTVNGATGTSTALAGAYKLYQWKLVNPTTVTISGTEMDEVKLYPEGAQMTTYTYQGQLGNMVGKVNPDGKYEQYDFDPMGRLAHVISKGWYNNRYVYNIRSSNAPTVYYNKQKTQSFTPKCAWIGNPAAYVVPAGKYSSTLSQADADAAAADDILRNGQVYVDVNALGCDKSLVNVKYNAVVGGTILFENTINHKQFSIPFTTSTSSYQTAGTIPKGHYNVTVTASGNHQVAIGLFLDNTISGTGTFNFTNVEAVGDIQLLVN